MTSTELKTVDYHHRSVTLPSASILPRGFTRVIENDYGNNSMMIYESNTEIKVIRCVNGGSSLTLMSTGSIWVEIKRGPISLRNAAQVIAPSAS